ncbi:MAG: hypothetical protein ABL923_13815 [Burkholderiaceae bacterium]
MISVARYDSRCQSVKLFKNASRITMALLFLAFAQTAFAEAKSIEPPGYVHIQRDDYINYLGSRCRTLHDELNQQNYNQRYTEARMLRIRDLRREYDEYCQEELRDARSQSSKAQQNKRQERLDYQKQSKADQVRQQQDEERKRQLCSESRRIILAKKQRTDLNSGELQELARFEESFRTRC